MGQVSLRQRCAALVWLLASICPATLAGNIRKDEPSEARKHTIIACNAFAGGDGSEATALILPTKEGLPRRKVHFLHRMRLHAHGNGTANLQLVPQIAKAQSRLRKSHKSSRVHQEFYKAVRRAVRHIEKATAHESPERSHHKLSDTLGHHHGSSSKSTAIGVTKFNPLGDSGTRLESGAVWTQSMTYGTCQELHVDLVARRLLFLPPDRNAAPCAFVSPVQGSDIHASGRFVAVLKRSSDNNAACEVEATTIDRLQHASVPASEFALFDAFSEAEVRPTDDLSHVQDRDIEIPYDGGALVRLEDTIEENRIASSVIAARNLDFGQVHAVEPKTLHVLLEDLRGSTLFDERDVSFKAHHSYIGVRIGLGSNPSFPQHLLFYACDVEDDS